MRMKLRYPVFYDKCVNCACTPNEKRISYATICPTVSSVLFCPGSQIRALHYALRYDCLGDGRSMHDKNASPATIQINLGRNNTVSSLISLELQPPTMTVGELKGSVSACQKPCALSSSNTFPMCMDIAGNCLRPSTASDARATGRCMSRGLVTAFSRQGVGGIYEFT